MDDYECCNMLADIDELRRRAQALRSEFDALRVEFRQSVAEQQEALQRRHAIVDAIDQTALEMLYRHAGVIRWRDGRTTATALSGPMGIQNRAVL
jgi:uncharacterized protein YeaO (DUF488 family)